MNKKTTIKKFFKTGKNQLVCFHCLPAAIKISGCPLEEDIERIRLNIVSWMKRQKLPSNHLVESIIHLMTGHINSQERGKLIIIKSLVDDSEQNSDDEMLSMENKDDQNFLIESQKSLHNRVNTEKSSSHPTPKSPPNRMHTYLYHQISTRKQGNRWKW